MYSNQESETRLFVGSLTARACVLLETDDMLFNVVNTAFKIWNTDVFHIKLKNKQKTRVHFWKMNVSELILSAQMKIAQPCL